MVRAKPIKIVVLGMGNLLLRDEGIGIHVVDAIKEMQSPSNVELEVVDGGTLPNAPLSFEEVDKLIIVDAVQADGEPGTVYRFHPEDINLDNKALTSLHQISLLENLWLMDKFGQKPKDVVIIGIEPQDMSWGLELSTRLEQCVPQIIEVVLGEISSKHPSKPEKGE
jgi:hydrogenase maturation protease